MKAKILLRADAGVVGCKVAIFDSVGIGEMGRCRVSELHAVVVEARVDESHDDALSVDTIVKRCDCVHELQLPTGWSAVKPPG